MKNKEVVRILQALQRLDGYNEAGAFVPYQIDGNTAYAIAKNIRQATIVNDDMEATRVRLLKASLLPDEKTLPQSDERFPTFVSELEKALDQEADFKPHQFKVSGLKLDVNTRISRNDLATLIPLLHDEDPAPVPAGGAGGVPADQ